MGESPTNLLRVEGFDKQTTEQQIRNKFSPYGPISRVQKCKKFFIIEFATAEIACTAKQNVGSIPLPNQSYASVFFYYPNKPDILAIYNVKEKELKDYQNFFKPIPEFNELVPIKTPKGITPLVIVTFKSQIDIDALIVKIRNNIAINTVAYQKMPYCNLKDDSPLLIARSFEDRLIFLNSIDRRYSEEEIYGIFKEFGKIIFIDIIQKYEVYIVSILMDTRENTRRAIDVLNRTRFHDQELPVGVYPFLERTLYHKLAGLLVLNELEPDFDAKKLMDKFKEWGDVYALSVAYINGSFVALILYADYQSASNAKIKCTRENTFLFPKMNAEIIIRAFSQRRPDPDLTLVTFDNPNYPNFYFREKYPRAVNIETVRNGDKRTLVATFKNTKDLIDEVKNLVQQNRRYEIIGSSTFNRCFDYFKTLRIESSWNKKIFYARGIDPGLTNKDLRIKFSKIKDVEACLHLYQESTALILFKKSVDKNNKDLLTLMNNTVVLDNLVNFVTPVSKMPERSQSVGDIKPGFQPVAEIIKNVSERMPELKNCVDKNAATYINSDQIIELSIDINQQKLDEFFKQLITTKCPCQTPP